MSLCRGWLAVSLLALAVSPAVAGPWKTEDQASVASQLGSALANANWCNFGVDTPRVAAVINERLAPTGKLTPEMASELMFQVVGVQALQGELLQIGKMNKRELAKHCASIIGYFGPGGSTLPGLLKP